MSLTFAVKRFAEPEKRGRRSHDKHSKLTVLHSHGCAFTTKNERKIQMNIERRYGPIPTFDTKKAWALFLQKSGFSVMPGVPNTKVPSGSWAPWIENQSEGHIGLHWGAYPRDEVCILTGHRLYVLDADGPESMVELARLEEKHGIFPSNVVNTSRGVHHYFGRPEEVVAKQDSHKSAVHPQRLDVKTGRSLVMGPGSPGKSIEKWDIRTIHDLVPVSQAFVDDVARLNGCQPPSELVDRAAYEKTGVEVDVSILERLVRAIPPDGYDVWFRVGMCLHFETQGSAAGLAIYDNWSAQGHDYVGSHAIRKKWQSFRGGAPVPCTIRTLMHFAKQHGADVAELLEPFERVATEVVSS